MVRTVKSQTGRTILLLGLGYTARALIPLLKDQNYKIIATTRQTAKAEKMAKLFGITGLQFSGNISNPMASALNQADLIISSIPPGHTGDPVAKLIAPHTQAKWVGYLSATSVYGDRGGQWVFEDELLYPTTQRGKNRVEAELDWLETGLPVHIFRLAGIYGPDKFGKSRNPFERITSGSAKAVIKPGHVVNRIHVDDIAQAVLASIKRPNPMQVYNIADGNPAPPQNVLNFAADVLGQARPPATHLREAEMSDMARSFYSETKRVSIRRAQTELGWDPDYKDYRAGLMSILVQDKYGPKTIMIAGTIKIPTANLNAVRSYMKPHIDLTRAEPGCEYFNMWEDPDISGMFHVSERFLSESDYDLHRRRMAQTDWANITQDAVRDYEIIGL